MAEFSFDDDEKVAKPPEVKRTKFGAAVEISEEEYVAAENFDLNWDTEKTEPPVVPPKISRRKLLLAEASKVDLDKVLDKTAKIPENED